MVHKFDVCLVFNHPSFSSNLFIGKGANAALKSQQNVIPVEQDPIISSNISNALMANMMKGYFHKLTV